ncbi:MAG: tetratricopeptide repeat protein, partial [Alphaproteobacteria bacterium]
YLTNSGVFLRSVMLSTALFTAAYSWDASAQTVRNLNETSSAQSDDAMAAYRKKQQAERDKLYHTRKAFPPPEAMAQEPGASPAANLQNVPATRTRVITRSSPSYQYLSDSNRQPPAPKPLPAVAAPAAAHGSSGSELGKLVDYIGSAFSSDEEKIIRPPTAIAQNPEPVHMRAPPLPVMEQPYGTEPGLPPLPTQQQVQPEGPQPTQPQPEIQRIEMVSDDPNIARERIVSPGVVINRTRVQMPLTPEVIASATPEQLAAFAPSAGESDGVSGPLIQVSPADPNAPPISELPPLPDAPAPIAPLVQPPPSEEDIKAVGTIVEESPAQPAASEPPMALPPIEPNAPAALPQTTPAILMTPAEPLPGDPINPQSEPEPSLSQSSQKIINRLPPLTDEPAREPRGLDMDRAKDTSRALEAEVGTVEHDAQGVNIKIRTPTINISYELEKAYNALVSGDSAAAKAIYMRILGYDPKNIDALFGLATLYHRARMLDDARPLYGKILAIEPDHREALNNFLVLLSDEAPQAALEQLEMLEKKSPSFSPIPAQMAVIYQKLGDMDSASKKMFKAVALAPDNLTYRYNLAVLLDQQGNREEAGRLYHDLIQAHYRGETIPGNVNKIQERLTFLRSNKP